MHLPLIEHATAAKNYQRVPTHRQEGVEHIVNRNEVATKDKGYRCSHRPLGGGLKFSHEKISETTRQKEMKNNGPVEGQIQRQKQIEDTERVKHPWLDGCKQRHSALDIGVPEEKVPLTHRLNPNETERLEKTGEVSLNQEDSANQGVAEIEKSEGENPENGNQVLGVLALKESA